MYEYPCRLIRVNNGNTIEADIDLGFGISIKQKIRLFGVDAVESDAGKATLATAIPTEFIVKTIYSKRGKIGRVLGIIFKEDSNGNLININELLIEQGLATKFNT